MARGKTPRKTLAEIKAEERMVGFNACMRLLEREWRSKVRLTTKGPVGGEELWPLLEKMQAHAGLLDEDFKALNYPRVFGTEFLRLRKRVKVLSPHPHAGRTGFILDSKSFMTDGMYLVYFLDAHDQADNAFALPSQIKRLE